MTATTESADLTAHPSCPEREHGPAAALRPLAPGYVQEHHRRYVEHLDRAITNPKIKNLALTGRYGSGKSSVLDEFEARHKRDTIRISINTLGPDGDDEDLTNRIQKELVKQLVYRARPGQVRRSRFVRGTPLTRLRALMQAVVISGVGLALLWLLGLWPQLSGLGGLPGPAAEIGPSALFATLIVMAVWAVRWLVGNRIVSQFATAGTTFTLDDKPDTYFDKFLDEIMTFFDAVRPRFVIFEDLDRFDDPQIFDSLRELNTLVNTSARRKHLRSMLPLGEPHDEPVRFIFAIKDSLFERLGVDPSRALTTALGTGTEPVATDSAAPSDVAAIAVERANRTKFFELVIPMVPFISHRNARDLLLEAFTTMGLPADLVSRPLLDLVARHTTDMRLMINLCNEFAVFAEHLLWVRDGAPGMIPDDLFALVAYKNFHLADFEAIAQCTSSLDKLEQHHRNLVRVSVERLQARKRALRTENEMQRAQDKTATALGERLIAYKESLPRLNSYPYQHLLVAGQTHAFEASTETSFWREVAEARAITISHYHSNYPAELGPDAINALFPEGADTTRWRDPSASDWAREQRQIDADIAFLRGADFSDLVRRKEFEEDGRAFDQIVTATLHSELARDLVRRGFIGRNFAEYSAKFYGSFIGVDVAFFYNHSVQPNVMYIDHQFETPGSVKNLLEQVPDDFTSTASALNIEVVNYLLANDPPAAKRVAAFIASDFGGDATTFLSAFLNETSGLRAQLVGLLAEHPWPDIFDHLATNDQIPDEETRIELLDSALLSARAPGEYTLNEDTLALLARSHPRLAAFTQIQSNERTKTVFDFIQDTDLIIADLAMLGAPLLRLVIATARYELTAHNLRVALGTNDPPTLERVQSDELVWHHCRDNIDRYLGAIQDDEQTEFAVTAPETLSKAITDQHGVWTDKQLRRIVSMSSPTAALLDLTTVPEDTWPMVLDLHRVAPTAANVWAYARVNGVDEHLAKFLTPDGRTPIEIHAVNAVGADELERLGVRILNANTLPTTTRVQLAARLDLPEGIKPTLLAPAGDDLLARALEAKLVPDDTETFSHFAQAGWDSVSAAFAVSTNMDHILSPGLVSGFVAELLDSPLTPDAVGAAVVGDLASYVPLDDVEALRAVGKYAARKWIKLPQDRVRRIAAICQDPDAVLPHLGRARDASADDLVATLALLGPPYDLLASGPHVEFGLPPGSSNNTLFERLAAQGRVEIVKNERGSGKTVRTLA